MKNLIAILLFVFLAQPAKIDSARLLDDDRTLASDSFEGREAGTPGGRKAQEYIISRFQEIHLTGMGSPADSFRRPFTLPGGREGVNLVGYLKGSKSGDRYLVVTAHFDHLGIRNGKIYHGADDNASGVAGLLASASYFAAHQPEHSILFVAFDAEEIGLLGSKAFFVDPPVKPEAMVVDVNLDMISRNRKGEIFASGLHQNPALRPILQAAQARGDLKLRLGHDVPGTGTEDWTNQSDHYNFYLAKVPFIYLGVEDHEDYHKPTDTFEKIDKDFFIAAANLTVDLVAAFDKQLK
jgi:Zn-dependent M28 family amino/carboxypeptidase